MCRLRYLWLDRRYLLAKRKEKAVMWMAWHLPKKLVMWCYYRVAANATTGQYGNTVATELTMMDAIQRWEA